MGLIANENCEGSPDDLSPRVRLDTVETLPPASSVHDGVIPEESSPGACYGTAETDPPANDLGQPPAMFYARCTGAELPCG